MAIYRKGYEENILGGFRYVIQKKYWLGWFNYLTFSNKTERDQTCRSFQQQGNIFTNY